MGYCSMKTILRSEITECLAVHRWHTKVDFGRHNELAWDEFRGQFIAVVLNLQYEVEPGLPATWTTNDIPRGSLRGIPVPVRLPVNRM